MKKNLLAVALTAAALTLSGFSVAQARDGRDRDDRPGASQHGGPDAHGPRAKHGGPKAHKEKGPKKGSSAHWQGPPQHSQAGGRGAGPDHDFYKGGRLSNEYRSRQYVVNDWRGHRLSAPPRGYHWVQTGGDYVLVAIASGIILQIFLGQ